MKKLILPSLIALAFSSQCQLKLPELSPEGRIIQNIGYVNFEIYYGRPAARGRKIFGELVPYGQLWRTGAGKGTTIKFDKPITLGRKEIPAGIYSLTSIPNRTEWTVLLNSDTSKIYGAPEEYDVRTEMVRLSVKPEMTQQFFESLTLQLDIISNNGELYISWENTQIHFPILTSNNASAWHEIETKLTANPNDADNLAYAVYYLQMNKQEPDRLMGYIDRALKIKEDWWYYELKMSLLTDGKKYEDARKVFQTAQEYLHRVKPREWEYIEKNFKVQMTKWK